MYFPNIVDIKYTVRDIDRFKYGGLNKLATDLGVNLNLILNIKNKQNKQIIKILKTD